MFYKNFVTNSYDSFESCNLMLLYNLRKSDNPMELSEVMKVTGLSKEELSSLFTKEELESLDFIKIIDEDTTYEEAIDEYYMNTFKEVK